MKIKKINIPQNKLENNFLFYLFLKELNSTNGIKQKEIHLLLEKFYLYENADFNNILSIIENEISKIKSVDRKSNINQLLLKITNTDILNIFIFSLKLLQLKPLLLEEAKVINTTTIVEKKKIHSLSLAYDEIGKNSAYYTRVNGALLSLLFFKKLDANDTNFISNNTTCYIKNLLNEYCMLKECYIEPNQIFMLMFSESINQSITSSAGSAYEDRIYDILLSIGIEKEKITKIHDDTDKSTEYDFFFAFNNKNFGIGAKRTLRERYKQFIKTNYTSSVDIMIEITLGLDLSKEKANTIRKHNTYLFVADEIYNSRKYLQEIDGIFPASKFNIETLKKLR